MMVMAVMVVTGMVVVMVMLQIRFALHVHKLI
jgi:hypothetical protein